MMMICGCLDSLPRALWKRYPPSPQVVLPQNLRKHTPSWDLVGEYSPMALEEYSPKSWGSDPGGVVPRS